MNTKDALLTKMTVVRFKPETHEKLQALADAEGRPVTALIRHVVEQFVEVVDATPTFEPLKSDMSFEAKLRPLTEEEAKQAADAAAKAWQNTPDSPEFKAAAGERLENHLAVMNEAQARWAKAEQKRQAAFKAMMRRVNRHLRVKVRVTKGTRAHGSKNRSSKSTRARAPASASDDGPAAPDPLPIVLPPAHSLPAPAGSLHFHRGVR